MLAVGTQEGVVQCWDPRQRCSLGTCTPFDAPQLTQTLLSTVSAPMGGVNNAEDMVGYGLQYLASQTAREITTLRFDPRGLQLAVGTSTGHVAVYDIRRGQPLLVKDHMNGLPILDIKYHDDGEHVVSSDSKSIKVWEREQGKTYTTIQPPSDVNDVAVFPASGMIFAALETERLGAYFLPSLGPAPKWCHFLDSITEEMEEAPASANSMYDDYKFVTKEDLERLSLTALLGTKALRPYMHGFFIDQRLYTKAVSLSQPFAYEKWRKERVEQKIAAKTEGRIAPVVKPKVKVGGTSPNPHHSPRAYASGVCLGRPFDRACSPHPQLVLPYPLLPPCHAAPTPRYHLLRCNTSAAKDDLRGHIESHRALLEPSRCVPALATMHAAIFNPAISLPHSPPPPTHPHRHLQSNPCSHSLTHALCPRPLPTPSALAICPQVNAEFAEELHRAPKVASRAGKKGERAEAAAAQAAAAGDLLDDARFSGLFNDPNFQIDKTSDAYTALHPHEQHAPGRGQLENKKGATGESEDEDDDDNDDDDEEEESEEESEEEDEEEGEEEDELSRFRNASASSKKRSAPIGVSASKNKAQERREQRAAKTSSKRAGGGSAAAASHSGAANGGGNGGAVRMIGLRHDVLKGSAGVAVPANALPASASFGDRLAASSSRPADVGQQRELVDREMSFSAPSADERPMYDDDERAGKGKGKGKGKGGGKGGAKGGKGGSKGKGGGFGGGIGGRPGRGGGGDDRRGMERGMLGPGKGDFRRGKGGGRGGGKGRGRG